MGDKPKTFVPNHGRIRDDVIGREFASCLMRSCPEPHVIQRFGVGGEAHVSVYTCRRCKYSKRYKLHSGVGCGYELDVQ